MVLVGVGILFVGMAVIDMAKEVGECVIETTGATEERDLEAAASHLARAIAIIGVLAFMALFAQVARGLGRKRVGGGEAPAKPPTNEPRMSRVERKANVNPQPTEAVAPEKSAAERSDGKVGEDKPAGSADAARTRGLPPDGIEPPVAEPKTLHEGPASRSSERGKGGRSLWDPSGGEWRYSPEDKWHNPHWDYNPHDSPVSPWQNVPIDPLPPRK